MIIKIATKLPVQISMPDASIHYLQSSSSLPDAEVPGDPAWQGLTASRFKLPSSTPGGLPIHV